MSETTLNRHQERWRRFLYGRDLFEEFEVIPRDKTPYWKPTFRVKGKNSFLLEPVENLNKQTVDYYKDKTNKHVDPDYEVVIVGCELDQHTLNGGTYTNQIGVIRENKWYQGEWGPACLSRCSECDGDLIIYDGLNSHEGRTCGHHDGNSHLLPLQDGRFDDLSSYLNIVV